LKRLTKATDRAKKSLPRELAAALNAVARKAKRQINVRIRTELVVKAGDLNKLINVNRKASKDHLVSGVNLPQSRRLSLRVFGARHIKSGVSYRISKREGRKQAAGAFMGPRPGVLAPRLNGGVFARVGTSRLPIRKLKGPSPWGVFVKQKMTPEQERDIREELTKQMERRIKLNILRAEGLVAK
jgi:hypothetical protein